MNMLVLALCIMTHLGAAGATQNVEVTPARVDLGELWQGEVGNVSVKVHNRGTQAIHLGEVKASCGCINVKMPKQQVAPGEEMEVKAEILRHTSGRFHEPLIIKCEGTSDLVRVNISGSVRETYRVYGVWQQEGKPRGGRLLLGEARRCPLPDLDTDDQGIELQLLLEGARAHDPFAGAVPLDLQSSLFAIVKDDARPGPQGQLQRYVTLRLAKPLQPGLHSGSVKIKIGAGPILTREISFRVRGPVWPENLAVNLGILRDGQVKRHTCKVHFRPGTENWPAARVLGTVPPPFSRMIEVADSTLQEGILTIELQVDPGRAPPEAQGFFHFELHLSDTRYRGDAGNVREGRTLAVQVYGMRRP